MAQRRAKQGGELGANGEWYEGGKFIATTDHAKKRGSYKPTHKWLVAPGELEVPPEEGLRAIFQMYHQMWMHDSSDNLVMRDLPVDYWGEECLVEAADALERWKAGERWQ